MPEWINDAARNDCCLCSKFSTGTRPACKEYTMKKSYKTHRAFLCALFSLLMFFSVITLTGCPDPSQAYNKGDGIQLPDDDPNGSITSIHYSNETQVSDEWWKEFIETNFTNYDNKFYKSDFDQQIFKIENDELYLVYGFSLSKSDVTTKNISQLIEDNTHDSSAATIGKIIGVDTSDDDGEGGFMLLLEACSHYNWGSYCYDDKNCIDYDENYGDGFHDVCYIPVHIVLYSDAKAVKQSCYVGYDCVKENSTMTACFRHIEKALEYLPYGKGDWSYSSEFVLDD